MNFLTDMHSGLIYVNFNPVTFLTSTVQRLYLSISDNLSNSCLITYTLNDSFGGVVYTNSITFDGTNYANWTGDNGPLFGFVAGQLNLTLI